MKNLTARGIKWLIIDIIAILVIVAGCFYVIAAYTSHAGTLGPASVVAPSASHFEQVSQPPSAKAVAASLGCGQYKEADMSGAHIYVVDAGVCWIGGTKYGIDTFASKDVRDEWIKAAGTLGVVVLKQNDTSVFYKASDQTHDNK